MKQQILDMIKQWMSHRQIKKITWVWLATISRIRNSASKVEKNTTVVSTIWEPKITKKEDNWVHTISYEWWEVKTKEDFFKAINFDESCNEVLSYQCNLRPVVIRVSSTSTKLVSKYEHFLRTKPISWMNTDVLLQRIEDRLTSIKLPILNYNKNKEWKLLEICLFDAHINKKSYKWEPRNCEIAKMHYLNMVAKIITKAKSVETFDEARLVIGNDFLNSDSHSKTTSWTPQDNVESEEESFAVGLDILITAIKMIQRELNCNIKVVSIPWNHSRLLEQVMWTALKAVFASDKNVYVDNKQSTRKYYQYWNTAIMFSHWDWCKQDNLPMLFANEEPILWGNSKYRQVHLWHIHSKTVSEKNWVIIRHLSSITTTDRRHEEQGYVWNRRWWQAFIFDKEIWEEAEFNFYI